MTWAWGGDPGSMWKFGEGLVKWGISFWSCETIYILFEKVDHHHSYFLASDVVVKCVSDISCGNWLSIISYWTLQYFPCLSNECLAFGQTHRSALPSNKAPPPFPILAMPGRPSRRWHSWVTCGCNTQFGVFEVVAGVIVKYLHDGPQWWMFDYEYELWIVLAGSNLHQSFLLISNHILCMFLDYQVLKVQVPCTWGFGGRFFFAHFVTKQTQWQLP